MTSTVPTATDHSSAFLFATQTPIRNTPTYEDCIRVYSEVKANAAAVPSTLGGTFHGHLGLVLSTEEYAVMVPNTPYIRAPDPGELGDIVGTVEARANLKNAWQTQRRAFLDDGSDNASQGTNTAGKSITYCFTHGITQNLQHNSKTCARKCDGHKDNATLNNKMGGSTNTMQARKPRN